MGTRCFVDFVEGHNMLATVYVHSDGYPSGVGADLKRIIGDRRLSNGLPSDGGATVFNGMGCLAAYVIGALKGSKVGRVYMVPPGAVGRLTDFRYRVLGPPSTTIDTLPGPVYPQLEVLELDSDGKVARTLYVGDVRVFDPDMELPDDEDDGETP